MTCTTQGRVHQTTTTLPLSYQHQELFSTALNARTYYKLAFLRRGNDLLSLNDRQVAIVAPTGWDMPIAHILAASSESIRSLRRAITGTDIRNPNRCHEMAETCSQ